MATVLVVLAEAAIDSVSGTMAALVQTLMHSPQSMHRSSSMTARSRRIRMAWVGHTRMHAMHPWQALASNRIEW